MYDDILRILDGIAREYGSFEFGIPVHDEGAMARMNNAIRDWRKPAEQSVQADGALDFHGQGSALKYYEPKRGTEA